MAGDEEEKALFESHPIGKGSLAREPPHSKLLIHLEELNSKSRLTIRKKD
jgi:hypothetical protein